MIRNICILLVGFMMMGCCSWICDEPPVIIQTEYIKSEWPELDTLPELPMKNLYLIPSMDSTFTLTKSDLVVIQTNFDLQSNLIKAYKLLVEDYKEKYKLYQEHKIPVNNEEE